MPICYCTSSPFGGISPPPKAWFSGPWRKYALYCGLWRHNAHSFLFSAPLEVFDLMQVCVLCFYIIFVYQSIHFTSFCRPKSKQNFDFGCAEKAVFLKSYFWGGKSFQAYRRTPKQSPLRGSPSPEVTTPPPRVSLPHHRPYKRPLCRKTLGPWRRPASRPTARSCASRRTLWMRFAGCLTIRTGI